MPPSSVHFNGSVNLPDTETVMKAITSRIPRGVRRIPDGETGERGYWIQFQLQKFSQMPELEAVTATPAYEPESDAPRMRQLRLADGVRADTISWPNLGYADAYTESFATYLRLRKDGTIPADVRFQVQYPTPLASIAAAILPEDLPSVLASYEAALFADLSRLLDRADHQHVAVQWDVAVEFGLLEGAMGPVSVPLDQIAPGIARCLDQVPSDVPVGLHLCYGDYEHQHFKQPESLGMQVKLINAVGDLSGRPLSFVSFTVPQGRDDADYFAPLSNLVVGAETELYFALVPYHPEDQPEGTSARQVAQVDAALAASSVGPRAWGVCTECGMGRVASADVPELLDLHRAILAV
jgi:hypothetical protein